LSETEALPEFFCCKLLLMIELDELASEPNCNY
jgi:hypothetical protein